MTVKQVVKENKTISLILGVLATALMAWGIWVTDASYKVHFTRTVELANICLDIDELRVQQKETHLELREQRELITKNQEKIYLLLMDIEKQIKKYK